MRYFGTDGIRDRADKLLENNLPFLLGKALSMRGGKVLVARDVRTHSLDIEKQLCRGLLEGNAQIWLAGVLPTPALAYIAEVEGADYAVMITASHNSPEFNGLKVFGRRGKKLSCEQEKSLDTLIGNMFDGNTELIAATDIADETVTDDVALSVDEQASSLDISVSKQNHRIRIASGAEELYRKHIVEMFPRLDGIKVRLDCACGCFAQLAPDILEKLGASVCAEHNVRDGSRVNVGCGSTHIQDFLPLVKKDEIGFSFDGDGDRVLAVVDGKVYDGDGILLALATLYRIQGKLKKKLVVGTALSNSRLQKELAYQNIALVRTDVGDKHVLDALTSSGCLLGGEKSGHILMLDKASTGDGLITAISLLEAARLMGGLPEFSPFPMLELNVHAKCPKEHIGTAAFKRKIHEAEQCLEGKGRLIVRPSGTEPYIRIAFECFVDNPEPLFIQIKNLFCGVE